MTLTITKYNNTIAVKGVFGKDDQDAAEMALRCVKPAIEAGKISSNLKVKDAVNLGTPSIFVGCNMYDVYFNEVQA